MQTGILTYEGSPIHIKKMGQGQKLLFAFHGFDDDASFFKQLGNEIGHKYTIIALELPGLGHSEWKEKQIDKIALVTIVERFKLEFKVEKFDVLAVGLGALYALTLIEQRSEWIAEILMFSPMGFRRMEWQRLATQHFWAKGKIQKAVANPNQREKHLKGLINWGLLKKENLQQVDTYIDNKTWREKWNNIYPLHARLVPEIQKVRWNVKKDKIILHIFCSESQLTLKKDVFKFAKKQDAVFVTFLDDDAIHQKTVMLEKAAAIFNPRQ